MHPRLSSAGPSIFSVMSQLAQSHQAINLAQGFPNFEIDSKLKACIVEAANGNSHQYLPYQGLPKLREEIQSLIQRTSGLLVDTEQILVTSGATQALFTTVQALVNSGDEVVLLDPCYDCYEAPVLLVGAQAIHVPLNGDFLPDWERIKQAVNHKTRMIIINSPHNPSGRVWEEKEYQALMDITKAYPNLLVLSDEVYEYLWYGKPHKSVREFEGLKDKSIVVSSFGKSLQTTGWKIGYLTAPERLMNEILRVHQFLVFSVNSVMQEAIAAYLKDFNPVNILNEYDNRRQLFHNSLLKSRFELLPCEGTYFQLLGFEKISDLEDTDFCEWLIRVHGVAAIPVSVFYENKPKQSVIRLCFAKDDNTLITAAERLCKI